MTPAFAIGVRDPVLDADLAALRIRLDATRPPPQPDASPAPVTLARDAIGLLLRADLAGGPVTVRAVTARGRVKLQRATSLLARAVGPPSDGAVVDATAGLGRDTFELAVLGYRVLACEQHPVLAFLLRDAVARAALAVEVHEGDAAELLQNYAAQSLAAVYLDPMFPARSKSAQVKKEAQVLQLLVGAAGATQPLFAAAWRAARRVVVKRPLRAPPLAAGSTFTVTGRAVRFDVYATLNRAPPSA